MAKELHTTIKIDGDEYNINAEHANQADKSEEAKTANQAKKTIGALKLTKQNLNGEIKSVWYSEETPEAAFDGENDRSLKIVPATGGRFSGRITSPVSSKATLEDDQETILNVANFYELLTNVTNEGIYYNWDDGESIAKPSLEKIDTDGAAINCISIVRGNEGTVQNFAQWNCLRKHSEDETKRGYYVPVYLYIEERSTTKDDGTKVKDYVVYFGTADNNTATVLAINSASLVDLATKAKQLETARKVKVDLSGASNENTFDGSEDTTIGISERLPKEYLTEDINTTLNQVETNKTDIKSLIEGSKSAGKAKQLHTGFKLQVDLNSTTTTGLILGNENTSTIKVGVTGNLPASKVSGIVGYANRAYQDEDGNFINKHYYRVKQNTATDQNNHINYITISSSGPSGGNNGDIWIKYKA